MAVADLLTVGSFLDDHREEVTAVATVVVAVVVAEMVDRTLSRRARKAFGGELSAVADTRLRLVRRLTFIAIVLLGVALALSQFPAVKRVATGLLASSAVLGLVIGFAARQVLANAIAGILLAITQPLRIGDLVTFEGATGIVEDVRLTYTFLRADDGRRIVIPNERLAQSTIENHTIIDPRVAVHVSVWLPPGADAARALGLIEQELPDVKAGVAEVDKDGVRIELESWAQSADERGALAARIRVGCLELFRREGLSSPDGPE